MDNCGFTEKNLELNEKIMTMEADLNTQRVKIELDEQIKEQLTSDRDRYQKLYKEENRLRIKYESNSDDNQKLLYDTQKELSERRIRMNFTDKIIAGKQRRIDEQIENLKDKDLNFERLEEVYTDLVE